jgi:hypothetical protein
MQRFFPLVLAMFRVAASIAMCGWALARPEGLPESSRRLTRGSGILRVVIAIRAGQGHSWAHLGR